MKQSLMLLISRLIAYLSWNLAPLHVFKNHDVQTCITCTCKSVELKKIGNILLNLLIQFDNLVKFQLFFFKSYL